ncbi:hypothetical protein CNMCM5793_003604 [Aspergillus hiratsukae]|uniref:Uncharacterized protein n=1 Tax=Aspergillus hiratsukae TaxID=1194566 RepID=A0A8H6QEV8_9EURO|nr:hypothetical protein CNMCM5793_003604 [Aspergillus hiratsukae]KAF7171821.1 hypothetical protein CNMCM6106_006170 [Aspergillus hiratsukae]
MHMRVSQPRDSSPNLQSEVTESIRGAMQKFLGKPVTPPVVPTDEVVALRQGDSSSPLRENMFNLTLWFDDVLDVDKLSSALGRLVEIGNWRILGARLRANGGALEHHIPARYDEKRPGFTLTSASYAATLAKTLPQASYHPRVVCTAQQLDQLVQHAARPTKIDDWLYTDRPQLCLHVATFADATAITITWPHTMSDLSGIGVFLEAWTAILRGDETAVPELRPASEDPLATLGSRVPPQQFVHFHRQVKIPGLLRLAFRSTIERLFFPREEHRLVCVPHGFLAQLHAKAQEELHDIDGPAPGFVSESDVLLAWWVRAICAVLNPRPSQTILLVNIFDTRPILRETHLPPPSFYLGNAIANSYTLTTARRVLQDPLGRVAAEIRQALNQQRTLEQVEAQAALEKLTWERSNHPTYLGDGGMLFQVCANWGKARLYDMDFAGAMQGNPGPKKKPSFVHTTRYTHCSSWRNIGVVLGRDTGGNWWISWNLRAQLWPKLERWMEESVPT